MKKEIPPQITCRGTLQRNENLFIVEVRGGFEPPYTVLQTVA